MRRAAAALALAMPLALAAPSPARAASAPRVFIETHVNPSDPYLQAAAHVTVRVFSARALYHAQLDLQGNADVVVQQVGSDDRGTVRRDGRAYDVLTRQYLVFGQRSGRLDVPGPVLTAEVVASLGRSVPYYNSGGRSLSPYGYGGMVSVAPFRLHGEPIALDVRPRPAGTVGSYWLPAENVTLTRAVSRGSTRPRVGDALVLDLTIEAQGLPAEELPDLTALIGTPPGLRAYPDDPKLDNYSQGDTLIGRREQSVALIADRPGRFTLPPLALRWWDTVHNAERTVSVPPQSIVVAPSLAGATGGAAGSRQGLAGALAPRTALRHRDPWIWSSLALALAWLATLGAWVASGRRRAAPPSHAGPTAGASPSASRSRAAFFDDCRANDPRAARRHLLEWAAAEWPGDSPRGLNGLARRIAEPRTEALLRELDRACYAGGEWRGDALARALTSLPAPARRPRGPSPIAPLYR